MCELVNVARTMIQELGANVSIKNNEGLTAAEAIREEGDFDELADYLESVTPEVASAGIDTSALAYTDFRQVDEEGESIVVSADAAGRIDEIMRLEGEDGVNRDEELRSIVTEAIMTQMGRGQDGSGTGYGRRQRRENEE